MRNKTMERTFEGLPKINDVSEQMNVVTCED